jgi:hypothetical protein
MKNLTTLLLLFASIVSFSQEITGNELLEKTIQFQDPNRNWEAFKGALLVTTKTPKNADRKSKININLPKEYFSLVAVRDSIMTEFILDKAACSFSFNGDKNPSEEIKKKYNLNCERAKMLKDYYTYLHGLPMKLKDKRTIIDQKVIKKTFQGKDYLMLKVTYSEEVGKDTWCFYFDPKSYPMEVYQFFIDTSKNDGDLFYYQV